MRLLSNLLNLRLNLILLYVAKHQKRRVDCSKVPLNQFPFFFIP